MQRASRRNCKLWSLKTIPLFFLQKIFLIIDCCAGSNGCLVKNNRAFSRFLCQCIYHLSLIKKFSTLFHRCFECATDQLYFTRLTGTNKIINGSVVFLLRVLWLSHHVLQNQCFDSFGSIASLQSNEQMIAPQISTNMLWKPRDNNTISD